MGLILIPKSYISCMSSQLERLMKKRQEPLYDLRKIPNKDFAEYIYRGIFCSELTCGLKYLFANRFGKGAEYDPLKKLFDYVVIESLQNIIRHAAHVDQLPIYTDILCVHFLSIPVNGVVVSSGNLIANEEIPALQKRIKTIQNADNKTLKDEYRGILFEGGISEKGGAGLGLLTMAMRTNHALNFHFEPFNDQYSYYYFQAILQSPEAEIPPAFSLKRLAALHQFREDKTLLLRLGGDFNFEVKDCMQPILNYRATNSRNIAEQVFSVMKQMKHYFAHCKKKYSQIPNYLNGITVKKDQGVFFVIAGCLLPKSEQEKRIATIELVNNMSRDDLENLGRNLKKNPEKDKVACRAFAAIRMKGNGKLQYTCEAESENLTYFTVFVKILEEKSIQMK